MPAVYPVFKQAANCMGLRAAHDNTPCSTLIVMFLFILLYLFGIHSLGYTTVGSFINVIWFCNESKQRQLKCQRCTVGVYTAAISMTSIGNRSH